MSYLAPDERPDLAAEDRLTDDDIAGITARLDRCVGLDVPRFKRRVRQLKGLGLTISLDVGYRLSPRGRVFLRPR